MIKLATLAVLLWLLTINAALSAALATQPDVWTVSLPQQATPPRATMPPAIVTTPQPYALRYTLYSTGRESAIIQSYVSGGYAYVRHSARTEPRDDGTVRISVEFVLRKVR